MLVVYLLLDYYFSYVIYCTPNDETVYNTEDQDIHLTNSQI